ncbi:MAG: hypothetical protein HC850_18075 [Rhodomicrobium sp.]|nr:hypothetical protein [Rhodomicrobium sp.]
MNGRFRKPVLVFAELCADPSRINLLFIQDIYSKNSKILFGSFPCGDAARLYCIYCHIDVGNMPVPPAEPPHIPIRDVVGHLPWQFVAAGILWMGGGTYIMVRQRRKAGLSWWEAFDPSYPPFRHMDGRVWAKILLLGVISLGLAQWGLAEAARDEATRQVPNVSQPTGN